MTNSTAPRGAVVAGVIVGLEDYTVLDAVDDGDVTVDVVAARSEAPCPGCGDARWPGTRDVEKLRAPVAMASSTLLTITSSSPGWGGPHGRWNARPLQ